MTIQTIPKGWTLTTLGEVAKVQTGPFGSQLHNEDYVEQGTPIITVENLVNDCILHSQGTPKVSDQDRTRLKKYSLRKGDVVFSRVGSVDRCAYVSEKEDGWLFSGRLLRVRPNDDMSDRYIFYWITQESIKEYVRKIAVGATMPSINTELLSQVPISFPLLPEQRAIAAVLSALDDKIELLRRQSKILEGIAQTLFKRWFVDYEFPNEKGKPYKPSGGKMIDSELGEIPFGWQWGCLADVATQGGQSVSPDELHTLYRLGAYAAPLDCLYAWEGADKVTSGKLAFQRGEYLFGKLRQ